jgi:hypothetical protein
MGQYYIAVILGEKSEGDPPTEFVRTWVNPPAYGNGSKLMEHSYVGNPYVGAVELLLSPKGHFWKSRLVWAGDYADPEVHVSYPDGKLVAKTLYELAQEEHEAKEMSPMPHNMEKYYFLVNHTKKQYVDKRKATADGNGLRIHPLPLLTAEGNGRGGGDYRGAQEVLVGSWARDVISVERAALAGYTELVCEFAE